MKKKFYNSQHEEEVMSYYSRGHRSLKKEIDGFYEQQSNSFVSSKEQENCFVENSYKLINRCPENIEKFMQHAKEIAHVQIDYETLYIQNISQFNQVYQTLIHRVDSEPMKSKESASEIMDRYFKQKGISYELVQQIGKLVGIKKFCPYLVGDSCFMPDFGKNHPQTSWLALHQVIDSERIPDSKETYLFCRNNYRIILPLNPKRFTKRIESAASIYHIERSIVHFLTNFYTREQTVHIEEPFNVIHQFLIQLRFVLPAHSLIDILGHLKYFWASEAIKKEFGIEDPYLNQLRTHFEGSNLLKKKGCE